jgi:hypothetical protein
MRRGFMTGLWLRLKQKQETVEVAVLTAGDLVIRDNV